MAEYYDEAQLSQSKAKNDLKRSLETDGTECVKKKKLEDGTEVYDLELKYNRYRYIIKTVHFIFILHKIRKTCRNAYQVLTFNSTHTRCLSNDCGFYLEAPVNVVSTSVP